MIPWIMKILGLVIPGLANIGKDQCEVARIHAEEEKVLTEKGYISPRILMKYTLVICFWIIIACSVIDCFTPGPHFVIPMKDFILKNLTLLLE